MDDTHLSAAQYAPVIARLTRERDYLGKLYARMRANGFPLDDPLFAAVHKAWEAACQACVAACCFTPRFTGRSAAGNVRPPGRRPSVNPNTAGGQPASR
jgi:hypothetical protein